MLMYKIKFRSPTPNDNHMRKVKERVPEGWGEFKTWDRSVAETMFSFMYNNSLDPVMYIRIYAPRNSVWVIAEDFRHYAEAVQRAFVEHSQSSSGSRYFEDVEFVPLPGEEFEK